MCTGGGGRKAARRSEKMQREALDLQKQQISKAEEDENEARVAAKDETLRRRRADRRGRAVSSLVTFNSGSPASVALRSLFQPTGALQ